MHESYNYKINVLIIKHERRVGINLDMHVNKHINHENIERKGLKD